MNKDNAGGILILITLIGLFVGGFIRAHMIDDNKSKIQTLEKRIEILEKELGK